MLSLDHITFSCEDPERLAAFWAEFLDGYTVEGSWRAVGDGPTLLEFKTFRDLSQLFAK